MKKSLSPLLWLLLIPCQLTAAILFVWVGAQIDLAIFSNPDANGHGIPFFSAIFLLIAAAITLIVILLALVLTIHGFRQRKK